MKLLVKFVIIAILTAGAVSCNEDDDISIGQEQCKYEIQAFVNDVTGPETATIGETVTLSVNFYSGNGCYKSSRFAESVSFPKEVSVMGYYEGCICTEIAELITKPYAFTPSETGEYEFKFKSTDGSFIVKTILVIE